MEKMMERLLAEIRATQERMAAKIKAIQHKIMKAKMEATIRSN
jgi:hypothetical protein